MVEVLLAHPSIDVHKRDKKPGASALHWATSVSETIITLLLRAGADPNLTVTMVSARVCVLNSTINHDSLDRMAKHRCTGRSPRPTARL